MPQPILCTTPLSFVAPAIQPPLGLTPLIEAIPDEEWIDDDETPLFVEPFCAEPPMADAISSEQHEVAFVTDPDDDPAPEEPDLVAIGPEISETVYQYSLREPYACVW